MSNASDFIIVNGELREYKGSDEVVVVPEGVTTIGSKAFSKKTTLTKLVLPSSVDTIKGRAYKMCTNLVSINVPVGVEEIRNETFENCNSLTSIRLPYSIKYIGGRAFANCKKLERINIPDSVMGIKPTAFTGCNGLKEFILPENVTEFKGSVIEKIWNCFFDELTPDEDIDIAGSVLLYSLIKYTNESVLREKKIPEELKKNKWNLIKVAIKNDDAKVMNKILNFFKITNYEELDDYIQYASNTIEVKVSIMNYKNELLKKQKNSIDDVTEREYKL